MAKKPETKTKRKRKSPPKAVIKALLPLRVLEEAAKGPGWYERISEKQGGWHPRHPETGKVMNAEECLAWAIANFASDEMVDAMAARALQELGKIAFADVRELVDENGTPKRPNDIDDNTAAALASFELFAGKGTEQQPDEALIMSGKYKMHDKMPALRLIMQVAGKLVDKRELSGPNGGPIATREVQADYGGWDQAVDDPAN